MTIEPGGERELPRLAELARQGAILRRIADLEATIARRRVASLDLSSRGLPTGEVDRTIEILVVSLEFVRSVQAAMDGGAAGVRDERRNLAKSAS
jgi:hypothetical protein